MRNLDTIPYLVTMLFTVFTFGVSVARGLIPEEVTGDWRGRLDRISERLWLVVMGMGICQTLHFIFG